MKRLTVFTIVVLATAILHAQSKPAKAEPKFKAIWEPINVKEDLYLMSVHFVSPDEGWVAGGVLPSSSVATPPVAFACRRQ